MEKAIRDGFGEGLLEIGKRNDVLVLAADLKTSTRANYFAKEYPKRFFQLGICEQSMMSIAAGMATLGKVPYVNSFAAFSPGRNWEQLRVSVCYSNLPVKIHGSHAGLTVGADGATHQALEDIALTRVLPNMTVIVPCDANEAKNAAIKAYSVKGPAYIRTSRSKVPIITRESEDFIVGKAKIMKKGCDVTIVACGVMVNEALVASKDLENNGISAEVINCHTIKPLDKYSILDSVKETGCIVTAEEHQLIGGLGSSISELLIQNKAVPMEMVGVQDVFGESGPSDKLLKKYKLDSNAIIKAVKKVLKKRIASFL